MSEYLIRKLENYVRLSASDKRLLHEVVTRDVKSYGQRHDIVHEGDRPRSANLILSGFATRYKILEDGRRQIVAFMIPGDICDLRMTVLRKRDHAMGALMPSKVAQLTDADVQEILGHSARLERALAWNSLVDEAISLEWTVNLGRRDALERLAHLFCELHCRLRAVGLTTEGRCEVPLTQTEIADTVGVSDVHVNRTLMELRGRGLITLQGKSLTIHDMDRLRELAMFNPNYLHLGQEGRELDATDF
ncbi:Crp/Fnr family transcriptional regulator [Enterovirga sp.]|jgi:CRP-like cAMP-binding protein|uniref:Crp/Fnr family transcriptional regulator n=1 Tax=Enterovirga sp. TaxID=2026350 RepID=UPI0026323E57|nr:Crp/Fnr family transcriptional regulator [Enterovirga sp.]MDB5591100.1 transcriptional regulator, Crp/Fnr family [Enterovirga sp.]